jgi:hypothetical protein
MTMVRIFRNRKAYDAAQAQQRTSRIAREVRQMIETPVQSERMPVGEAGHFVQHIETAGDGRRKWMIVDSYGNSHGALWGMDAAVAACRQLIEEGKISR